MRLKLVAVAVAALAPVVAMLGYNEYAMRQQRSEEVRAQAAQASRQAASEVERIVEGLRSMMVAVTSMPSVRTGDALLCNDALKSLAASVPNIRTLFVLSPQGKPVCGSVDIPGGVDFQDREYFQSALHSKGFAVGVFTNSRISDIPVLPLAMPVLEDGDVKAVVVSGIRLDWLQSRITERGVAPGNAVTLADRNGTIVARVPLPERFVGTVIPDPFKKLIHADKPGVVEVKSQDGTNRVLGYRPISLPTSPLYVSAGFSTEEAFAPINKATINNSIGIGVGALVALVLAMFIGERFILSPIARISEVMSRWRDGETLSRTAMVPGDELHAVGASLDSLLDELDCRRVQNERAAEDRSLLVSEMAHRVKNGFTLVQAIARQTFAKLDPESYRSFSERLTALAASYDLFLSKEGAAAQIRDVLTSALRAHSSEADRISLSGPDVLLPADLALPLSLVVHELATNATKYGSLGVETGTVDVSWKKLEGSLAFCWREAGGPPIAAPTRKGFGTVLIERAFPSAAQAQSRSDFRPEGLSFEMKFRIEDHVAPTAV